MTYVLAWKTNSEVFLTADSALTTVSPDVDRHSLERSSFGEPHVFEDGRVVEERTLKLFLKHNIGVALAGRYDTAIAMVGVFYEKITEGMSPPEALNWAIFAHAPALRNGTVQLAVAYFTEQPQLLYFDGREVREDQAIVHLGSAPPGYKEVNENWLDDLPGVPEHEADSRLAAMMGILQSHGVLNPTLQTGIGGAFAGLYVDHSGGHWQPDFLFIEYGTTRFVSSCIRNNCFIINSPILGESRCFMTFIPPRTRESLLEQTRRAIDQANTEVKRPSLYNYAFIMNTTVRGLTLIHMNKKSRHRMIWIEPVATPEGSGTTVRLYPRLRDVINRTEEGIVMMPYMPSDERDIPEDRIIRREIKPEE